MKKLLPLCYCVFIVEIAFSQNLSSLSGRIIDAKTKEPLPSAVVFLAHTTIGTYANEDGFFTLESIPNGKYDLTCSMLGYKSVSRPMEFKSISTNNLIIALEQESISLESVTITARKQKTRHSDYVRFAEIFLGQTSNSYSCKILNPQDIYVYTEENNLKAVATKPIIIKNAALGYLIHYELKEFSFNSIVRLITFSGIPRFEELSPTSAKQKAKWIKERDRAFYGSTQHFLLSLKHGELSSSHYKIHNLDGKLLTTADVMKDSLIYYRDRIYISFEKELPEIYYPLKSSNQLSEIIFTGAPIKVYENGYFEDFHHVIFEGYIGWSSSVAELMPMGYKPSTN